MNYGYSPFAPPSYYYAYQPEQNHYKREESSQYEYVRSPFSLGARSIAYVIILLLSLACIAFSIVVLCAQTYVSFTMTTSSSDVLSVTFLSFTSTSSYETLHCDYTDMAQLERAVIAALFAPTTLCIKGAEGAKYTGIFAIVCIAVSALVVIFVVAHVSAMCCQWQREEDAQDASVRQGLSVATLILSIVCLAISAAGLAMGITKGNYVQNGMSQTPMNSEYTTRSSNPLESMMVWPFIPIIVCSAISTVLLFVPYLSGIADCC